MEHFSWPDAAVAHVYVTLMTWLFVTSLVMITSWLNIQQHYPQFACTIVIIYSVLFLIWYVIKTEVGPFGDSIEWLKQILRLAKLMTLILFNAVHKFIRTLK